MNDENTDLSGGVIKSEVNMKHIIVADFSPQFLLKHSGLKSALPINYFTFNHTLFHEHYSALLTTHHGVAIIIG